MAEKDENALARAIAENDHRAIATFYHYFYDRIYRIVFRKLGSNAGKIEDCKDLASEILWHTIVSIQERKYQPEKGRLAFYMYGIANNHCKIYFKSRKKERQYFKSTELLPNQAGAQNIIEDKASLAGYAHEKQQEREAEVQKILEKAIETLDDKYKRLIYHKYYRSLSYELISREENLPLSKVKSRLFEARRVLEKAVLESLRSFSNFLL